MGWLAQENNICDRYSCGVMHIVQDCVCIWIHIEQVNPLVCQVYKERYLFMTNIRILHDA